MKQNKVNPITDATKDALLESLYNYGGRHDYLSEEYEPFEDAAPLLAQQGYIKIRPTGTFTTLMMNPTGQDMYLSGGFRENIKRDQIQKTYIINIFAKVIVWSVKCLLLQYIMDTLQD